MMLYLVGVLLTAAFMVSHKSETLERERWVATEKPDVHRGRFQLINIAAFTMIAAVGIAMLLNRPLREPDLLDKAILLLLAWIAISVSWATDRRRTLRAVGGWLAMGCAAFGVGLTCSLDECVLVAVSGCVFFLAIGLPRDIHAAWFTNKSRYRVQGWLGPNYEADEAFLLLFLVIYLYQSAQLSPGLSALLAGVSLVTMLLARSRTVTWAALVALPVWILFSFRSPQSALVYGAMGLAGLCLIGVIAPLRNQGWWLLMHGRKYDEVKHLNGRTILWANLWPTAIEHPLLGSGYRSVWNDERYYQLRALHNFGARIAQAHSIYLEALLGGGVVALLLLASVIAISALASFQLSAPAGPMLLGLITYAAIHGFGESALLLPRHRSFAIFALLISMTS